MAYTFHFPPSEMWEMDTGEMDFWAGQAQAIHEAQRKKQE